MEGGRRPAEGSRNLAEGGRRRSTGRAAARPVRCVADGGRESGIRAGAEGGTKLAKEHGTWESRGVMWEEGGETLAECIRN